MASPRFDPSRRRIAFFSRGRGRGHAVPDVAIAEELYALRQDIEVRFISYATGVPTFSELGHSVIDLDLPEASPVIETLVRAAHVTGWLQPQLVVAHEEFSALPAAKIFGLPTVFLTDWFLEAEQFSMTLLAYADETIFLDVPGIFDEPVQAKGRVYYVGPVLRPFSYGRTDRSRARRELGLAEDAVVISVLPGSWTEEKAPIFDLVASAFDFIQDANKSLIWIAGSDYEMISRRVEGRSTIIVKRKDWQMDRLMVASDLAITKATRKTNAELAALGIPSISLSYGLNRVDDARVARIPSNLALKANEISARSLADHIETVLKASDKGSRDDAVSVVGEMDGRVAAAKRLAYHIDRLPTEGRKSVAE